MPHPQEILINRACFKQAYQTDLAAAAAACMKYFLSLIDLLLYDFIMGGMMYTEVICFSS